MKQKLNLFLCLCLIICSFSFGVKADDEINESTVSYVENEVIVTTNVYYDVADFTGASSYQFNGVSISSIRKLFFESTDSEIADRVEKMGNIFTYCITIDSGLSVESAISILLTSPNIDIAEPNFIFSDIVTETNYAIDNVTENLTSVYDTNSETSGSETGAVEQWAHEYLNIDGVWGSGFVGSDDVRVAIIDGEGFVQTDDLQNNLNMTMAFNTVDSTNNVAPDMASQFRDHGTFMAGIIGADYNDGGVNGICQNVTIVPIKHNAKIDGVIAGCEYAIANGAKIISHSYTMSAYSANLIYLIESNGVLLIGPALNSGIAMEDDPTVTGWRNDSPNVVVVGSMDSDGNKSAHSNYSKQYVDLFAPGSELASTGVLGTKQSLGTSYAAPHFAAACALIMSKATHLTPLEVKELLLDNVTIIEGLDEYCVTGGALNISSATSQLYNEYRGVYTKGDITGDGYVKTADYLACKQIVFGTNDFSDAQRDAADVNNDGNVTAVDYLMIEKFVYRTNYFPPFYD